MMGGFVVSMQTHYTASPAQYADHKYTSLIAPSNNEVRKIGLANNNTEPTKHCWTGRTGGQEGRSLIELTSNKSPLLQLVTQ